MNQQQIQAQMLGQKWLWRQKRTFLLGLVVECQSGWLFFRPEDPNILSKVEEAMKAGAFTGFIGVEVHDDGSVSTRDRLLYDDAALQSHQHEVFSSAIRWLDIVAQKVVSRADVRSEIEEICQTVRRELDGIN